MFEVKIDSRETESHELAWEIVDAINKGLLEHEPLAGLGVRVAGVQIDGRVVPFRLGYERKES